MDGRAETRSFRSCRRALWAAIDQTAFKQTVVGTENDALIRNPLGFFGPGTPMASDSGVGVLTSPRSTERAKALLHDTGYRGETVALLIPSTSPTLASLGAVATEILQRCRMMVEPYLIEFNAMLSRRTQKGPVDGSGWSAYVTN